MKYKGEETDIDCLDCWKTRNTWETKLTSGQLHYMKTIEIPY